MVDLSNEKVIAWSEIHASIRQFEYKCDHKIDLWDLGFELEEEEEMIEWLKENANGKVYCNGDFVFRFEDEADLMAFKIMWL